MIGKEHVQSEEAKTIIAILLVIHHWTMWVFFLPLSTLGIYAI